VILNGDQIVSTGYAGAPRGSENCTDIGTCLRDEYNVPSGQRYELCRSVHAEMNAVINAARAGVSVLGGMLYLHGENADGTLLKDCKPCQMCRRVIINAGIKKVVALTKEGVKEYDVHDWLDNIVSLEGF